MIIIRGSEFGVRNRHCETHHPERRNREGGDLPSVLNVRLFAFFAVMFLSVAAFAAPKSASAYYSDAAFQYIENRLPSAEITCNEGLQYYPNDQKLQMLLDRIHEAKDKQKNENKKNDKNQDNNQDQNGEGNSSGSESSSSASDEQDQNGGGQSSSSDAGSSGGEGSAGEQPEPEQPEEGSSDSQGDSSNDGAEPEEQPVQMGEMSPEEAAQLLKDFDEQNGERKPWKPIRGQARPAKDW